jgi:phosphonoacetate hydrolase
MPRPKFLFVLFDGLRRDMVRPDLAPAIHGFREDWCEMANSSAVFPSETRVQVSALVTGNHAGGHGVMGNDFYDPALELGGSLKTNDAAAMAKATAYYGRMQMPPTLGEIASEQGLRYSVLTSGKIGNARLLNLHAAKNDQATFTIWGNPVDSPAAMSDEVIKRFGPVPEQDYPNVAVQDYMTELLLGDFLGRHNPDIAVFWMNEPDLSYHYREIGSADSREAIAAVDRSFKRILDWWHAQGRAEGWHIIAASDHGQITVSGQIDVAADLRSAGFKVGKAIGPDVDVVLDTGYSGHIVVRDRDPALVAKVADHLRAQDWCGLLFCRDAIAGSFPAGLANVANDRTPDIYFTLLTGDDTNRHGYPGTCLADNADIPIGGGLHGGMHRIELNTLLVMGGDLFREQVSSSTPCGTVDIAPTMLSALGVEPPATMVGRVLGEALAADGRARDWHEQTATVEHGSYRAAMKVAHVEGAKLPYLRQGYRMV